MRLRPNSNIHQALRDRWLRDLGQALYAVRMMGKVRTDVN